MKKNTVRRSLLWAAVAAGVVIMHANARADVPGKILYQAKLTDTEGKLVDTHYDMAFTLFTVATGGTAVWTETHANVPVTNGMFTVMLGSTADLLAVVRANDALFLEISVAGDTLSPRQELASAAYAISGMPGGAILMWSGTLDQVPSGWALCDGTNGTPDMREKFVRGWSAGQNPGGAGGAATHSHTYTGVVAHTHSVDPPSTTSSSSGDHQHSTDSQGAHTHTHTGNKSYLGGSSVGGYYYYTSHTLTIGSGGGHTHATDSQGAHTQTVDVASFTSGSTGDATCTTAAAGSLPPYYQMAFIMKR